LIAPDAPDEVHQQFRTAALQSPSHYHAREAEINAVVGENWRHPLVTQRRCLPQENASSRQLGGRRSFSTATWHAHWTHAMRRIPAVRGVYAAIGERPPKLTERGAGAIEADRLDKRLLLGGHGDKGVSLSTVAERGRTMDCEVARLCPRAVSRTQATLEGRISPLERRLSASVAPICFYGVAGYTRGHARGHGVPARTE